jgi:hypothetical protein
VSLLARQCPARQSAAPGAEVVLKYVGPECAWVCAMPAHSTVVGEHHRQRAAVHVSGGEVRVEIAQPGNVSSA